MIQDTTCYVSGRGVTKVEFFVGSTLINTDTTMANGMGCVLDTTKFANGSHTLTAVAHDASGRTYREPRSIRIQNAVTTTPTAPAPTPTAPTTTTPTAPTTTVKLPAPTSGALEIWTKAPAKGATVSGVLQGNTCYMAGRGVSRVEFFIGNTRLNTDSVMSDGMSCVLDTTRVANGAHTLRAVAYNSAGSSYTELVPITVRNTVSAPAPSTPPPTTAPSAPAPTPTAPTPTVSLPSPTSGALEIWFRSPRRGETVSGQLALDKCYVAGRGVSRVEFFIGNTRLNTDSVMSDGMSCVLDTTKVANGTHSLRAVAYDSAGRSYPETISINVQNAASAANVPPTVSMSSPAAGATLSGTAAAYSASASDSDGTISKVEVFVGSTLVATSATGTIDTTKLPNGAQTLMVVATDDKGATGTTQRSVTINNTATSNPGGATSAPTSGAIDPAHIVQRASAEMAFSQQGGFNAQVIGQHLGIDSVPESGVHGTTLANGETMRFGKVVDPVDSARRALMLQVHRNDPNTSGSKRTELRMGNNIEWDKTYWAAFSVYVYDWGTLSSSDQALYGIQLHSGDDSAGYSPAFAIYTVGNGRRFNIQARSPSGTQRYAEQDIPFGRWVDYVFKFKQNTSGTAFLQVWQDGVQIVDHRGDLGYPVTQRDYFKFGYYNWTGASSNNNARKVLLHAPTIVADPTGNTYSAEQLRALVASSSGSGLAGGTSSSGGTTASTGATAGGVCSTALCVVTQ